MRLHVRLLPRLSQGLGRYASVVDGGVGEGAIDVGAGETGDWALAMRANDRIEAARSGAFMEPENSNRNWWGTLERSIHRSDWKVIINKVGLTQIQDECMQLESAP